LSCSEISSKGECVIRRATRKDEKTIRSLVKRYWGEEEQLTFGRTFSVAGLPTYLAKRGNRNAGFLSYSDHDDSVLIVALGVLPQHQGSGVGSELVGKVEAEARRRKKSKLLVSTSNDDLPALGFYQHLGFQLYEVKPDVIANKHGAVLEGIGGLPIRDELRLRKVLT
jgi:ribosomal protein S18 acetylase RimI-like enzyme